MTRNITKKRETIPITKAQNIISIALFAPITIIKAAPKLAPEATPVKSGDAKGFLASADYVALVFARSGLGIKQGVCLSNGVGVIDSDYRGEIAVGLVNLSDVSYTVQPGDRIAQLMVTPVVQPRVHLVPELDETERGAGGFGSTGR